MNFKLQTNDLRPPQADLAHIDQVDRTWRVVLSKSGVITTGGLNLSRG
jgi:hypothetical protein